MSTKTPTPEWVEAMTLAHEQRISTMPLIAGPKDDGKVPVGKWAVRQDSIPSDRTFRNDRKIKGGTGYAMICGEVSGNLELFEFEAAAVVEGVYDEFRGLVEDEAPGLIDRIEGGLLVESSGGGLHYWYRCTEPVDGPVRLARREMTEVEVEWARHNANLSDGAAPPMSPVVLIETRGEHSYGVGPGSSRGSKATAPKWRIVRGGIDTIATISADERAVLFDAARSLDQMPTRAAEDAAVNTFRASGAAPGKRPGDAFNAQVDWTDVLIHRRQPADRWVLVAEHDDVRYWRRPGGSSQWSATTNYNGTDRMIVFSTATPFDAGVHADGDGVPRRSSYSKFDAEVRLGGYMNNGASIEDAMTACARQLALEGFGVAKLGVVMDIPMADEDIELKDIVKVFRTHLLLPKHPYHLYAIWSAVVANHMDGDQVSIYVVGASSSGKTEAVDSLGHQPYTHMISTLSSTGALLSGSSKSEVTDDSTGGVLRQVGDFGIIVMKEFTSLLELPRDARSELFAAIREILDGRWTRALGNDGGKTLEWEGKVGIVAAVTPVIDKFRTVHSLLGERFVAVRMPDIDPTRQGGRAARRDGDPAEMRAIIASATDAVLTPAIETIDDVPDVTDDEIDELLVPLAAWTVLMRSPVHRSGGQYDIDEVPTPELPARLVQALVALYRAGQHIGLSKRRAHKMVRKIAYDSVPPTRLVVLRAIRGDYTAVATISERTGIPQSTVTRRLEDMRALGILAGGGRSFQAVWSLDPKFRDLDDIIVGLGGGS